MRKLSIVTTCVVTVVVVVGLLFGTPYYTLWRAREAANARDADTLSSYVDYPAVRDSLKTSLHDQMARQMDKQRNNPLGALALALGGWVSDRVVEALLTPVAVAAMLRGDSTGLPPAPGSESPAPAVRFAACRPGCWDRRRDGPTPRGVRSARSGAWAGRSAGL